jgi:hypothetical protein
MRRILLSLPFLLLSLLFALPALAGNWGEDWGTLTWGAAIAAVPTMGWLGGALLVGLLVGVGMRRMGGRAGAALGLLLALGYAPVAEAQTVSVPNTLSNGSVAEADAMNENFGALRNAVGVTVPNTFVNGTPADANEVNANFQALKTGVETCLANAAAAAAGNQAVCESVGGTWAGTTCTAAPCDVTSNDAAVAAAAAAAVDITIDNAAAYADGVGSVDITTDNAAVAAAAAAAVDITTDNEAMCTNAGGTYDPDGVNAYCADDSFTVNEGTISGDGELVLLDNQHADISAADLGNWGTGSFDLDLSIKANSGTNIASDGDYAVLFARSQESGSPWTGPMAFVWNDGQVLFRLRGDEGLLLPAGTVSSWSDWVNLRFLHDAATQTIRVFVNGVEAGNRAVTLTVDPSHITGAPLRFGGNHDDPDVQNLNARIRNIVRVDFADPRCTEFVSLQPLFWDVGITDSCTVDITTDNAAVAQATCTTAGGTWNAGTSTCTPASPTSSYNCFVAPICAQGAWEFPPATFLYTNVYAGHYQTTEPALGAGCNEDPGAEGRWGRGTFVWERLWYEYDVIGIIPSPLPLLTTVCASY